MAFQTRVTCTYCSGRAQTGTAATMAYLMDRFPRTGSYGIYNCRRVAGTSTRSQHSCGRAGDSSIPTSDGRAITSIGYPVVQFLTKYSTELGIVEIIYNRVMYDRQSPSGRYYGGVNPHRDHVHWAQTPTKARYITYAYIVANCGPPSGPPPAPPSGGGPLLSVTPKSTVEDIRLLQIRLKGSYVSTLTPDGIYGPSTIAAVKRYLLGFTSADPADPEVTAGKEVNAAMWDGLEVTYLKKRLAR